jgi:hypothetical protein
MIYRLQVRCVQLAHLECIHVQQCLVEGIGGSSDVPQRSFEIG